MILSGRRSFVRSTFCFSHRLLNWRWRDLILWRCLSTFHQSDSERCVERWFRRVDRWVSLISISLSLLSSHWIRLYISTMKSKTIDPVSERHSYRSSQRERKKIDDSPSVTIIHLTSRMRRIKVKQRWDKNHFSLPFLNPFRSIVGF